MHMPNWLMQRRGLHSWRTSQGCIPGTILCCHSSVIKSGKGLRLIFTFSHDRFPWLITSLTLLFSHLLSSLFFLHSCTILVSLFSRCHLLIVLSLSHCHCSLTLALSVTYCLYLPLLSRCRYLSLTLLSFAILLLSASLLSQYVYKPSTYYLVPYLDLFVVGTR